MFRGVYRYFAGDAKQGFGMNFKIDNLLSHPEYIFQLSEWHHREWGYLNPTVTIVERQKEMQMHLLEGVVPSTFVATCTNGSDEQLVGSAALVQKDMNSRSDLSPWLASVYVAKSWRRRGIGTALVRHALEQAKNTGVPVVYLFTPDKQHFYERLGWQSLRRERYSGIEMTIMNYDCV